MVVLEYYSNACTIQFMIPFQLLSVAFYPTYCDALTLSSPQLLWYTCRYSGKTLFVLDFLECTIQCTIDME